MNDKEFAELLQIRRGERACTLNFSPCIEHLMDTDFCRVIDKIIHESGLMWERHRASESLAGMLPESRGLYMFVWKPELAFRFSIEPKLESVFWTLYVGKAGSKDAISDTIKKRYSSEYRKYVGKNADCLWSDKIVLKREDRLARYLTLRPLEFWFITLDDIDKILLLEKRLIETLRPPLNQQHSLKVRPGKPVPAFEEFI